MLYPYRMTGTREPTEPEEHKMLRLLGTLLGVFVGRANPNRTEEI